MTHNQESKDITLCGHVYATGGDIWTNRMSIQNGLSVVNDNYSMIIIYIYKYN